MGATDPTTAGAGELSLFAYPWDFVDHEPEQLVGWCVENGVDRLVVATAYHSAEMLLPRRRSGVLLHAEPNTVHLPLPDYDGPVDLRPSAMATGHPDLLPNLSEVAKEAGLGLTAWVVALHNSGVAASRPDLAMVNCFGDRQGHGLCPAGSEVGAYVRSLVAATLRSGCFDEVFVESLSYLPLGHGHPHELWSVPLEPIDRLLASLCFCDACSSQAMRLGIEVDSLRAWVSQVLERRWNSVATGQRIPGDGSDLLMMVLGKKELRDFLLFRQQAVSTLTQSVAEVAHAAEARLACGTPVFARPLSHSWLEAVDLGDLAARSDRVTLMPYYEQVPEVQRDVDLAQDLMPGAHLQMLQTLWPTMHSGSLDVLLAKVAAARSLGVRDIGLYNLGTATRTTLDWIPAVAELVHGDVT